MANQIFYGAGQNARNNISRWLEESYHPVCFVDADENKWGAQFTVDINGEGYCYDILPIHEAMAKYPYGDIYITPTKEKWDSIANGLVKIGIATSNIKFFEPFEYRKGCISMGSCFLIRDKIGCCCSPEYSSRFDFDFSEDWELNFEQYEKRSQAIIDDWRHGRPSVCDGCPNITQGIWEITPQIFALNISSVKGADFCNTKCIYCCHFPKPENEKYEKRGREVIAMLESAHKRYPDRKFSVIVSGGDIAVAPFRNEIFILLKKYGWRADIYSNSSVYFSAVAEQLKDGESTYVTTLDSTIRTKFAQIKGVDCLHNVLENIKLYSDAALDKRQIKIKLIILENVYHEFEDISGVADFAESIGAELMLSCNVNSVSERLSKKMFDFTIRFMQYAKQKKVPVIIMYDHFNEYDAKMLREQNDDEAK